MIKHRMISLTESSNCWTIALNLPNHALGDYLRRYKIPGDDIPSGKTPLKQQPGGSSI